MNKHYGSKKGTTNKDQYGTQNKPFLDTITTAVLSVKKLIPEVCLLLHLAINIKFIKSRFFIR